MEKDRFRGLGVAMITPFTQDKQVDFKALEGITEYMISNGVNYLVVMGTTGENPTISEEEQYSILEKVKEVGAKRVPIVFGIAGNNTALVESRLKSFDYTGVDAILSASPFYNKPNQQGIVDHYHALADASKAPIMLYNVPGRTGSMMHANTILKLAEHPNIFGVKEASGNFDHVMELLKNRPSDFMIISGDDAYTLPYISLGMDGVVSVVGNAYPKLFSQMVRYALDENFENARYLHYKLLPVINALFEDGNPGGVKELMHAMNLCEVYMRAPLSRVNEGVQKKLQAMAKLT
jgi:4-hydroxy-tetrahydrodipicolinate synthase